MKGYIVGNKFNDIKTVFFINHCKYAVHQIVIMYAWIK